MATASSTPPDPQGQHQGPVYLDGANDVERSAAIDALRDLRNIQHDAAAAVSREPMTEFDRAVAWHRSPAGRAGVAEFIRRQKRKGQDNDR